MYDTSISSYNNRSNPPKRHPNDYQQTNQQAKSEKQPHSDVNKLNAIVKKYNLTISPYKTKQQVQW
jgi:hypothetical protein